MAASAALRRVAEDAAQAVGDEEAVAGVGARGDLDAGDRAIQVRDEPWQDRDAADMQRMGEAVQLPGLEPGVEEDHL